MTDAFTAATPTYQAAKATDQSRGRGWDFSPLAAPAPVRPHIAYAVRGFVILIVSVCALWGLAAVMVPGQ